MTTEERVEKLERDLAREIRRTHWLMAAVVLVVLVVVLLGLAAR